ncbi:diguanylate cyclase [Mameliella alba]|nr:diguanylate cyclase [Antarctobacter heliothermus]MBY6143807.1 diguanylate cyclase [Mameliella alba]MBY6162461.1 diguanylate cyclase [Mameliella alba]MBY6170935.1 diguanylate cyclase [Mameliella alba]MBY6175948.1 diguanylate cyclase [Mameliella alba]
MTGRILIVDSVPTNRIILRVKLSAAYYEVIQADCGATALSMLRKVSPDLVITATELPDMTGRALCAAINEMPLSIRIPVVVLHGEDDPGERLASLAAGADDVLTRPIDDLVMLARLRSLLRARDAEAELQLRDDTQRALGLAEQGAEFVRPGLVRLVSPPRLPETRLLNEGLAARIPDRIEVVDPEDALREQTPAPDVVVVAEPPGGTGEALTLLPQLRASRNTRHSALIYIAQPNHQREAASALDMGANDLLDSGLDLDELAIRLKKQVERKRTNDRLRANMRDGLQAAVCDPLTGLYNRRYAVPHVSRLADRANRQKRPYALLLADLDYFKQVNDSYGHAAGDAVLVTLAQRLKDNLRAADLISRWGGEEFLVAMPDADRTAAKRTAERLCRIMSRQPVTLPDGTQLTVTLSIGVAIGRPGHDVSPLDLIERADEALYAAKNKGRNTVVMADTVRPFTPRAGQTAKPPQPRDEKEEGRPRRAGLT